MTQKLIALGMASIHVLALMRSATVNVSLMELPADLEEVAVTVAVVTETVVTLTVGTLVETTITVSM